jgi:phosphoglucosamine mutase|tara:strand:+ start:1114 stop:2448 length:1335 start_codon:yes stop_codon:yes gene_type:complete
MKIKKKFFGTDGIRGKFGDVPLTDYFFFKLAITLSKSKNKISKILIGKDTRLSGAFIEKSLFSGFKLMNVETDFISVVSTPIVSFYTKLFKYDYGIMISASHNPYYDNGIKIFKNNGEKLNDKEELKIEKILERIEPKKKIEEKKISYMKLNYKDYQNSIFKQFKKKKNKLKIVLDCANGSVFEFAPKFFNDVCEKVISYSVSPNGRNINKNCGAMFPSRISKLTKKHKADIGLSFDGDADRVIISDDKGNILDGDIILAMISKYHNFENGKKIKNIVNTKMCNLAFRDFLKKNKIKLFLTKVGDRYVIEKMKKTQTILGGEPSGHIILSNNGYCGDGILTGMFIISIIAKEQKKLSLLTEHLFKKSFQKLVNLKLKTSPELILKNAKVKDKLKFIKNKNKNLDLLIRKSGTENLLRIMVQSRIKNKANDILTELVTFIKKLDG